MIQQKRVVVRRNKDTSELSRLFGDKIGPAFAQSNAPLNDKFKDEPWTYVPAPGVSTHRGSRPLVDGEGSPYGSPVDIIERELRKNPILNEIDPRLINAVPLYTKKSSNIVDTIGDKGTLGVLIPTQQDSIPPEFKSQYEAEMKNRKELLETTESIGESPNDEGGKTVMMTELAHPRQFPTEPIPSKPDPDMRPPKHPHHDVIIPPEDRPVPHHITEDMIVKTHGYNETNVKLMGEVSTNIALCSATLAVLNNPQKPVNVNEVMRLLQFMDDNAFRKTFAAVFTEIFNENIRLSNLITSYLNGTAEVPADSEQTTDSGETPASESAESGAGQGTPDNSVN